MEGLSEDLKRKAQEIEAFLKNDALTIIEVEGLNSIEEAFDKQGFLDSSLKKWEKRKTTNKRGEKITHYKTNRVGKRGRLNQYGRRNKGRAVLTGHNSGGNKLRSSYRSSRISVGVRFATDKAYAKRHNEGLDGMPKRQHVGRSKKLDSRILKKFDKQIDKILK